MKGWDDTWELAGGSYPSPVGGSELGVETYLGPGTWGEILAFWVLYTGYLTVEEISQINEIVTYMKPSVSKYNGIREPL